MTSTATLQAALDTMNNKEPSIGYSIAYPFGVIGPILCIYFMTRMVKPKFPPRRSASTWAKFPLGKKFRGQKLEELDEGAAERRASDDGAQRRTEHRSDSATSCCRPAMRLMVIAEAEEAIAEAAARLGKTGAWPDRQGSLRP